ncbi:hypothetical protein Btru_057507 [Bulinus truncatus]|nr:hypothetical protein Btru_057507 [Bulinus truncatus]
MNRNKKKLPQSRLSLHIRKEDKKKQKSDTSLTKTLKSITRLLILSVKKVFVLSCLFCFCYQPFSGFP